MVEAETALAEIEPRAGQIWKEVDPRFKRYVRIIGVYLGNRRVVIETVGFDKVSGWFKRPKTATTQADIARFNGKRGGYALHQDVGQ